MEVDTARKLVVLSLQSLAACCIHHCSIALSDVFITKPLSTHSIALLCDISILFFIHRVIECKGPTNTRVYTVAVYFRGRRLAKASGHSIQQAEMNAAREALLNSKGRNRSAGYIIWLLEGLIFISILELLVRDVLRFTMLIVGGEITGKST